MPEYECTHTFYPRLHERMPLSKKKFQPETALEESLFNSVGAISLGLDDSRSWPWLISVHKSKQMKGLGLFGPGMGLELVKKDDSSQKQPLKRAFSVQWERFLWV